jgi:hypothetical protein
MNPPPVMAASIVCAPDELPNPAAKANPVDRLQNVGAAPMGSADRSQVSPPRATEGTVSENAGTAGRDILERITLRARVSRAFRRGRGSTPTRRTTYPPRREAFIADAAMAREMHRL